MPRRAASSTSSAPWRWFLAACIAAAGIAHGQDAVDPEASAIWQKVRADLFASKPIAPGDDVVALEIPARAQDGAVVPLTIRARFPQSLHVPRLSRAGDMLFRRVLTSKPLACPSYDGPERNAGR